MATPSLLSPPGAAPSLYKRLGGYDAIAAVSDDFIGRMAADKTLAFTDNGREHAEGFLQQNVQYHPHAGEGAFQFVADGGHQIGFDGIQQPEAGYVV